jgi:hypothetical protein
MPAAVIAAECRKRVPPLNPPTQGNCFRAYPHTRYERWAMRPLRGVNPRVIEIRICCDHPVARTRANILPDGWLLGLWLVKIGQCLITVGTTSFKRDIIEAIFLK